MAKTGNLMIGNELRVNICNECGATAFTIYCCLLSYNFSTKKYVYPTQTMISKETGLNERTIIRNISTLVEKGYIIKIKGGVNQANRYYFPKEDTNRFSKDELMEYDIVAWNEYLEKFYN